MTRHRLSRRRWVGGMAALALPAAAESDPHAAHRTTAPDPGAMVADHAQPLLGLVQRMAAALLGAPRVMAAVIAKSGRIVLDDLGPATFNCVVVSSESAP